MKTRELNRIFGIQNCPICDNEPHTTSVEDADGSEAAIRCSCGLEFSQHYENCLPDRAIEYAAAEWNRLAAKKANAHWSLGLEYEYAVCSACGHMEYAGWNTTKEAEEKIGGFHKEHKYCPNCGAKMEAKE